MQNIVSRETFDSLNKYVSLLKTWNSRLNLIGTSTERDIWNRHILDSWQLLNFIPDQDIEIIDIGSGAGFPGFVLSVCGIKNVILVESNSKKCSFLLQAKRFSNNNVSILNKKFNKNDKMTCDILTCRAFSDIDGILEDTISITVTDKYLLLKGKNYLQELEQAQKRWAFDYKLHDSITEHGAKIIEIKNARKKYE